MEIEIKQILYGSPEYEEELELRNKVLRKPLGMNLYDQDLSGEKDYIRIAAVLKRDNTFAGSLLLVPLDNKIIQMKQMAVKESLQGQNIGRKIIVFAEELTRGMGYKKIILNARKVALEFYLKAGFETVGEEFEEIGIPHFKMIKDLK